MTLPRRIRLGPRVVDLDRREVVHDASPDPVTLTATEQKLLGRLMQADGQLVTAEDLLVDVWGYREGVRSRTVITTVYRLRRKLEDDPRNPLFLKAAPGGGGYLFDVPTKATLVEARTGLIGRRTELTQVLEALGMPGLVTLVGPGGVGKTRLVNEIAAHHAGTQVVPCATASDVDSLVQAVAAARGLRIPPSVDGLDVLTEAPPELLILDNMEQLGAEATLVVPHLARTVLATSRRPLEVAHERVLELSPLRPDEAVSLLRSRAEAAGAEAGFDEELAAEVVASLDGLPLAIELAALRLGVLSLPELRDRLTERLDLLTGSRGLEAVLGRSWELLEPEEQGVLAQLSVFRGPFTAAAAEAVCDDNPALLDILDRLRRWSLLRVVEGSPRRLALYESMRLFAEAHGDAGAAPERHARWMVDRATTLLGRRPTSEGEAAVATLRDALADLRAAIPCAGDGAPVLAEAVYAALFYMGPIGLVADALDRVLAMPVDASARARLTALRLHTHRVRGEWIEAEDLAAGADPEAPGLTEADAAYLCEALGCLELERGRPESAIAWLARVDPLDGAEVDRQLSALVNRGGALRYLGRLDEAADVIRRAVSISERSGGSAMLRAQSRIQLGGLELERGRMDLAWVHLAQGAEICAERGDDRGAAYALGNLGHLFTEQRRHDEAADTLERASDAAARAGDTRLLGAIRLNLGRLAHDASHPDKALLHYERARELLEGGDPLYLGISWADQGAVHHERHWFRGARDAYDKALELLAPVGEVRVLAQLAARRAALFATLAEDDLAAEATTECQAQLGQSEDPLLHVACAVHLSHLDPNRRETVITAAESHHPELAGPTPAAWSSEVRLALRILRRPAPTPTPVSPRRLAFG